MNDRWEKLFNFINKNAADTAQAAGRLQTRMATKQPGGMMGAEIKQEERERIVKDFMESDAKLDKQNVELFGLLCEGRFELFDTLIEEYIEANEKRRVEEEKRNHAPHHTHAHAKGFSLIELLIVVAIILIIAGIAIPRLLAARTTAVEGRAGSMTKTIGNMLVAYNVKWGNFPAALTNLGGTTCDTAAPTAASACLLDDTIASQLAAPGVGQYTYTYSTTGGAFTLNGDPIASSSAKRHFFDDTGLTVHYNDTAAAAATDPAM